MVKPHALQVHGEAPINAYCPPDIFTATYNCGNTCAHTAIIPTNSTIEVNAAASSTKIFNIAISLKNIYRTMILFCSFVNQS